MTEITILRQKLIGLTLEEARHIYSNIRVTKKDGIPSVVTRDLRFERLNVEIDVSKIVKVTNFG